MRGIAVVLVLVCLVSSAIAQCNHGVQSQDLAGCVCNSGYSGAACDNLMAISGSCASKQLSQTEATWFPNLAPGDGTNTASSPIRFIGNHLYARIDGNYVADRNYTELTFQGSAAVPTVAAPCHVGNTGSYWTQGTSASACNDTFNLDLPWAQHPTCGFANNTAKTDSDYLVITGYLFIRYVDALGEVDGFNLTRSTKVPYAISVRFQRHVTVQLVALNVTSDVKYGMALTEDTYDPVTGRLTLEVTSIMNWPNMFYVQTQLPLFQPAQVVPLGLCDNTPITSATPTLAAADNTCSGLGHSYPVWARNGPDADSCSDSIEKSLCQQKFTLVAILDQTHPLNCTYDGRYDIQTPLYTCRDQQSAGAVPSCTHADQNITFFIQDSYVCGTIGVAPTVDGNLYAFDPQITSGFASKLSQASTNFQLGKYAHFYAGINSQDNTISIEFRDISFSVQGSSNWVRLYNSSGWHSPAGGDANFADSYPAQPALVSGYVFPDSKYFRVYFHSSVFKVQPNSQVIYTFRATIDVSFKGNDHFVTPNESRKRTIETTWSQSVVNTETNVMMSGPRTAVAPVAPADLTNEGGVSSVTFIASVVGAVAGTMIIVFVVVGFALRARSANKDESSSALVAASVAAAEVANRA